ncbi:MAG TPA: MarR family transcriptional regulator [Jiangellaceae bacterium]|nr:MarR family transcriptional regulator [Jiangellaceae bacterium]
MAATSTDHDREEVLRFVERFAIVLASAGMARMPARVFAYALIDDADRYTATDLAEALRVSPAAISISVRDLVNAGLLGKQREPGDRTDTYVLYDEDIWSEIYLKREGLLEQFERVAAEGIELVGRGRPGGRRLAETAAYFAFMRKEMPELVERWRKHRQEAIRD